MIHFMSNYRQDVKLLKEIDELFSVPENQITIILLGRME